MKRIIFIIIIAAGFYYILVNLALIKEGIMDYNKQKYEENLTPITD